MSEAAKDLLRDAFHSGELSVNGSPQTLERFLSIFAGEMEALIAVQQNAELFTRVRPLEEWVKLAEPNQESVRYFEGWLDRI